MRLEVRAYAGLHRYIQGARSGEPIQLEVQDSISGHGLLEVLNIPAHEAFVLMVNGNRRDFSAALADGDRIGLFPPVGGG